MDGEEYEKETFEEVFLITKNVEMYGVDGGNRQKGWTGYEKHCRKKKMEIETDCRESGCDCVEITAVTGDPLPLGVKAADGKVNFAVSVPAGSCCLSDSLPEGGDETLEGFPDEESIRKSLECGA